MKLFVIGRKNWFLSNPTNATRASAMQYSLIETAKVNGLILFDYHKYCLEKLTNPKLDIDSLIPWNVKLSC
ncbi:MAG: transposase [Colwellia sp.]